MAAIPGWLVEGDWFDVCKCNIPCPCEFAQPPTFGDCEGILAWHINHGRYGNVLLDGLNVLAVGSFQGNIWKDAKATMGIFIDAQGDASQREALQTIFSGQAGGWPGQFAQKIGDVRGIEYAPIEFEVAGDLATFEGEPAIVAVVSTDTGQSVYAVSTHCRAAHPLVLSGPVALP